MQSQFTTAFIYQFGQQLPSLILFSIGIALSLYSRSKNPKKFLLTTISFSILLLISLANPIFSAWLITQYAEKDISVTQYAFRNELFSLMYIPFWLTAWIILFFAIFNQKCNLSEAATNQLDEQKSADQIEQ